MPADDYLSDDQIRTVTDRDLRAYQRRKKGKRGASSITGGPYPGLSGYGSSAWWGGRFSGMENDASDVADIAGYDDGGDGGD